MAATRLDRRRAAETCAEQCSTHRRSRAGLRQKFRRALGTGRARLNRKLFPHPRAHAQIQIHMHTEPEKPKTVRAEPQSSTLTVIVSCETMGQKALKFFICARLYFRIRNPGHAVTLNARLNHRRRPQDLSCARVQPHFGDQAGLSPCSGSFRLQSEKTREDRFMFRLKNRASLPFLRSGRSAPI